MRDLQPVRLWGNQADGLHYYESSMLERFRRLDDENFQSVLIERREDIWPSFKAFLSRDAATAE